MPKGATRRAAKRDPAPAPAGLSARGRAEEELPSAGRDARGRAEEELPSAGLSARGRAEEELPPAALSARGRAEEELPSAGLAVRGRPEEELARADRELIAAARRIIRERYYPERHHVGAALRTRSGKVFVGVHLEANVGRIAVCAEAAALAAAAVAGDTEIETIVAVRHTGQVVAPCGMCREMISDYAPQAHVILPVNGGLAVLTIGELLPYKYRKP